MSRIATKRDAAGFLRLWREDAGMTRPEVVGQLADKRRDDRLFDQATLAKWESGDTPIKVQDWVYLAGVYGVRPGVLFMAPGTRADALTRAIAIIERSNAELVDAWLLRGETAAGLTRHVNGKTPRSKRRS